MDKFTVRRLDCADVDMIFELNQTLRDGFSDKTEIKKFLTNKDNLFYAVVIDGKIATFAYGYVLKRLNTALNMVYIHEIGTLEQFRRKGLATKLFDYIKNDFISINAYKIFLITQSKNIAACSLYEKCGAHKACDDEYDDCDRSYIFEL